MKFLRVLCILALALCVTASVYAETQSVKVSGDLTMRALARGNYNYGVNNEPDPRTNAGNDNNQSFFLTNAEVEVDADLTDNVQTVIRLVNQREWNITLDKTVAANTTLAPNGSGGLTYSSDEFQVAVDLAYVTLKDFIYSPLTVTIGRQDLWFGRGFIIGANQQDPTNSLPDAPEYTTINSFDAVKAVLDYDPWTITGVYSNIETNAVFGNDGINLWGVNVGYKFDAYKAEAEAYWFYKNDNSIERWGAIKGNNDIHTLGLRGSCDPLDVVSLFGEGAWQVGDYIGNRMQINTRERSAYALDFGGELRYFEKYAWKPKLGVEYVLYSGNMAEDNPATAAGTYTGWDSMYRGKFDSAIREFVGKFYASEEYSSRPNYLQSTADSSLTNQSQVIFSGSVRPVESVLVKANYNLFWTMEDYMHNDSPANTSAADKTGGFIGQEVDLQANWDYTEDVSFGILGAFFVPGEVYRQDNKTATDLVGTVKVNF